MSSCPNLTLLLCVRALKIQLSSQCYLFVHGHSDVFTWDLYRCCAAGKEPKPRGQQHRPSSLWTYRVVPCICCSKKKRSACEICVPLFAGDYRLAHTPKSFVDCANITLEACSVTKHRNNEVQSAVTCELVE